ncbi:MAG: DUF2273 domain-containing protein [Acidimicrobiia bacterium]
MQTTTVGLFVGLILGLALAFEGVGAMIIVAFTGTLGYLTAKVIDGELDLSEYVGAPANRRTPRR